MFSGKNKKNKNKDEKNKSLYVDDSTRSVGHSPVELGPLLRKMERRKKASRALGAISSLIIVIGLVGSGYYIYKMFQPIESASISFDDIQDASPEEKQKSEENRNKPLTYENLGYKSDDDGEQLEEAGSNDKAKNDSKKKNKKNIQNGNIPSYIDNLPEKTFYKFNASIFSPGNDSEDNSESVDNSSHENSAEEDDEGDNSTKDEEEHHHKKRHKENSSSNENNTKSQSAVADDSGSKKNSSDKKEAKSKKVTLTIVGYDGKYILDTKSIKYSGTQTVASILFSACNKYGIPYKYKGSGSTVYISSMGGQAEKEHGSGSGWMVRVNGYLIDRSAGAWKVKDDDDIEWFYYAGSLENIPRE